MSVVFVTEQGWVLSHSCFVNCVYKGVQNQHRFVLNGIFFRLRTPFLKNGQSTNNVFSESINPDGIPRKKRKSSVAVGEELYVGEIAHVRHNAEEIIHAAQKRGYLYYAATEQDLHSNNLEARQAADTFYHKESKHLAGNFHGGNGSNVAVVSIVQGEKYLIPPRCRFFCYDVREMQKHIHLLDDSYDFILLDPPWWNKYIRRKKSKSNSTEGYQMMYDEDVAQLPISSLAASGALVAVWCTNADSHLSAIRNSLFPAWGVTYIGKWFWLKVTCGGQTVCAYSVPPGKQPFEQIVFGWFQIEGRTYPLPEDGKIIVSVPSALHSHKPPLTDVVAKYLPPSPQCLELFARYLLPGYTSWGTEVLKLQQMCLYQQQSS
ncbi:hypothetical protein PR048_015254 [Dryococelus australis]|uniref:Methyltransferase-like protein 4 n=1 Tax=Dryococelus australis TaxID=614101 RepID=A0ABQ9HGG3_9NEOP|nr:hypothetical protein PR048_015254 [Dryococelus australis]